MARGEPVAAARSRKLHGRRLLRALAAGAAVASAATPQARLGAETVFTKKSLYRNLAVEDEGDRLCLRFDAVRNESLWQSCQDKDDPDRLLFEYTQMSFVGLVLQPHPQRVLVAGLGGGSIPRAFLRLYPKVVVDAVEIDPAVIEVARTFFALPADPRLNVIERDARVYVKAAKRDGIRYDYIVLDAFNGEYIPEHLMTREFLEECRAVLAPGGVLVANTFSRSRLYDSESRTYQAAFGWLLNVKHGVTNRIVVTQNGPVTGRSTFRALLETLVDEQGAPRAGLDPEVAAALAMLPRLGIDLVRIAARADDRPDWEPGAPILTDQYSPANLLNQD
jgi:spermidine synthase